MLEPSATVAPILSLKKFSQGHLFPQIRAFTDRFSDPVPPPFTPAEIPLRLQVTAQGLGYYSAITLKLSALLARSPAAIFPDLSATLSVPPCSPKVLSRPLTPLPGWGLAWQWEYGQLGPWLIGLNSPLTSFPQSFSPTITAPVPWGFVQYAQLRCTAMVRLLSDQSCAQRPEMMDYPVDWPGPLRSLLSRFVSTLDDWETRPGVKLATLALALSEAILTFEAQAWLYRQSTTPAGLLAWQTVLLQNCQTLLGIWLAQARNQGQADQGTLLNAQNILK